MHIQWWMWISVGLLLLVSEALTPGGFYLLFVGIAAILAGLLALAFPIVWIQVSVFALLSALLIVLFRKPLVERVRKTTLSADTPEFIGETVKVLETIAPDQEGKVELRGSLWQARNRGTEALLPNSTCTIIGRDGLKLQIK